MTSALRIAIAADVLVQPTPNGTRTFMRHLVSELIQRHGDRFFITFFTTNDHDPSVLTDILPQGNWSSVPLKGGAWVHRLGWLGGAMDVSRTVGPHDAYLSGWHWPLGRRDHPFVAILHDVRPLQEARLKPPTSLRDLVWRWLSQSSVDACCQRAVLVICPSRYTRDHFVSLTEGQRCPPTIVIPHGIDFESWRAPVQANAAITARRRAGIADTDPYIIAVGQHIPHKNFACLIEAFARRVRPLHPTAHLVIAGGYNRETDRLRETIRQHGEEAYVHLLGFVSDPDLRLLVKSAQVFACPSLFEGFGIPVLEAFAAGTAVACSSTTAVGEVAGSAALTFDPLSPDACGDAIARLLGDARLRSELSDRGQFVALDASWAKCADAYADALERACMRD